MNRSITIKGTGKASVKPDLIVITLQLDTQLYDYEATMQYAAEASQELLKVVVEQGFDPDDLKTTDYHVDTVYRSYKDSNGSYQSRFEGYRCQQDFRLEFELNFKRLAQILSALSKAPVEPVFNIRFTIKDTTAVSEELLRSATENAKQTAEILADASGVQLGDIIDINYNWGRIDLYSRTNYEVMESDVSSRSEISPHIVPDDIDVSDDVTFVWEIH